MQINRVIASHGLGNQLFQYTFAHYLSNAGNHIVFENSPIFPKGHTFLLGHFKELCHHINFHKNAKILHESTFGRFLFKTGLADIYNNYVLTKNDSQLFRQLDSDTFKFITKIFGDKEIGRCYVGFWQHWKYLESVEYQVFPEIIQSLKYIQCPIPSKSTDKKTQIVVHVRRGDYLQRGLDKLFGIVAIESYLSILEVLLNNDSEAEIYTLTDDPQLIFNEKYRTRFGIILTPEKCNTWQGLKLMSQANIVISANSTYSWWGASLCSFQGGIGYTPKQFFKNIDTFDAFYSPRLLTYKNTFEL